MAAPAQLNRLKRVPVVTQLISFPRIQKPGMFMTAESR